MIGQENRVCVVVVVVFYLFVYNSSHILRKEGKISTLITNY